MHRHPSIHILESDLEKVFQVLFDRGAITVAWAPDILAKELTIEAKRYKLQDRKLLEGNAKVAKQLNKLTSSKRDDATVFAQVLMLVRRRAKHKGINQIKEGSKDWLMLKEVTKLANDFCNDFSLNRKEGYKLYCEIACNKLKPFSLTRFNSMHTYICHEYEQYQDILTDMTPHLTEKALEIYNKQLTENGGIPITNLIKRPTIHTDFIKAVREAKNLGVSLQDYMAAQFEGLAWASAVPMPSQLHGDKAIERVNKYLVKHRDEIKQDIPLVKLDFSKIRKIK